MEKLPISVIIAAKNAERTIEECLDSAQRNNPAEIIVVDGKSTDSTVEIARKYTDRVYSDEGKGFNYAQQLGAEQATQEYIALIDTDITLPEGSLAALLADLKISDCVSMQATLVGANLSTYWERAADWNWRTYQTRRGGMLSAAVLKRETILKYRLDASLKFSSDHDFEMRMAKEGHRLGTSSAIVYHHHRSDLKSLARQGFRYGRETIPFMRKYGLWAARFGPPVTRLYWIGLCLKKGKPGFIPYFIVEGVVGTAGMITGFFEMIGGTFRRERDGAV